MAIHIGKIIKFQADLQRIGPTELGKLLNRSRDTIYDIFERESVDTELLVNCCKVLNYDFFDHYYDEEPLLNFRERKHLDCTSKIDTLKSQLDNQLNLAAVQLELITTQRDTLEYLKALLKR